MAEKEGSTKTKLYKYMIFRMWEDEVKENELDRKVLKCYINKVGELRAFGYQWYHLVDWVKSVSPQDLESEFTSHEIMELLLEEE